MTESFLDLVDLASERFGGSVVAANDEFFAPKETLIKRDAPIAIEGRYTERGKWMDGWETRRRRDVTDDSHDWCIIRLGVPGRVFGVNVDTAHFKGNYPAACAIDLTDLGGLPPVETLPGAAWREVLPRSPLRGDAQNLLAIDGAPAGTHLRLRIYPDGGVARLRVHGRVVADWDALRRRGDVDLAAAEHGGFVVACSDMFFGSRHNLIMPGDAAHMGDGWETRRRRGPGHDWTIVRLAARGTIRRIEVDTRHFMGNAPGACSLDACAVDDESMVLQGLDEPTLWQELLPRTALQPDARHSFEDPIRSLGDVTHVRFNIYPDGGLGRLRLYGRPGKGR
jgi:allantoicase